MREAYKNLEEFTHSGVKFDLLHGSIGSENPLRVELFDPYPGKDFNFSLAFDYNLLKPESEKRFFSEFSTTKKFNYYLLSKIYECFTTLLNFHPPVQINYKAEGASEVKSLTYYCSVHADNLNQRAYSSVWIFGSASELDNVRVYATKERTSVWFEEYPAKEILESVEKVFGKRAKTFETGNIKEVGVEYVDHEKASDLVRIIMDLYPDRKVSFSGDYKLEPDKLEIIDDLLPDRFVNFIIMKEEKSPHESRIDINRNMLLSFNSRDKNLRHFFDLSEYLLELLTP